MRERHTLRLRLARPDLLGRVLGGRGGEHGDLDAAARALVGQCSAMDSAA